MRGVRAESCRHVTAEIHVKVRWRILKGGAGRVMLISMVSLIKHLSRLSMKYLIMVFQLGNAPTLPLI